METASLIESDSKLVEAVVDGKPCRKAGLSRSGENEFQTETLPHDQVTAHVAVEYFTIAHPPLFPTEEPFWLAVGWGIIATWWVGLILGIVLALSARLGSWPKLVLKSLKRPIFLLMIVSGTLAILFGAIGWLLTQFTGAWTIGFWSTEIDPERHTRFAFAAWAHSVSYLVGGIGGLAIAANSVVQRKRAAA